MVKWISHRGESADAPENTLPAFKLALERNTDGFETDIHLTADNVLICCHDANTFRTCQGVSMVIEESKWEDLKQLDASYSRTGFGNVSLPLFSDSLKYLGKDKLYYVEIKENDLRVMDVMLQQVDAAGIDRKQIVMISFHADVVRAYKEKYPEMEALFLYYIGKDEKSMAEKTDALIERTRELKADGIDVGMAPDEDFDTFVKKVHDAGMKCAVWTVDHAVVAKRWMDAGVDAITSNCAAKVRSMVETY